MCLFRILFEGILLGRIGITKNAVAVKEYFILIFLGPGGAYEQGLSRHFTSHLTLLLTQMDGSVI